MRSHLERYEFPNPFSVQEKICMIYSYLSLCYGLAVLSFLSFFIFVESMKWLGIKACLPFFLSCAVRHEHWIWYSHLPPSPCSLIRKKLISLDNSVHSDDFHSLVKCPKEISRVWVHTEKNCQLSYCVFGFWPSTIQHRNCATATFIVLLAKYEKTTGNPGYILQQMSDLEGFICLVMVSGQ